MSAPGRLAAAVAVLAVLLAAGLSRGRGGAAAPDPRRACRPGQADARRPPRGAAGPRPPGVRRRGRGGAGGPGGRRLGEPDRGGGLARLACGGRCWRWPCRWPWPSRCWWSGSGRAGSAGVTRTAPWRRPPACCWRRRSPGRLRVPARAAGGARDVRRGAARHGGPRQRVRGHRGRRARDVPVRPRARRHADPGGHGAAHRDDHGPQRHAAAQGARALPPLRLLAGARWSGSRWTTCSACSTSRTWCVTASSSRTATTTRSTRSRGRRCSCPSPSRWTTCSGRCSGARATWPWWSTSSAGSRAW